MGSNEQTIDISDTHTYSLAPAANVQTVILTKSKPGIVDLTHPDNVTWVPAPPELTSNVGSVVYLVFIKTGSGWQGYSAGDLDNINELLATLPPMKAVLPNAKRGNSDFWNYVEEANETEKAKVKGGPLSQVGRTELKLGKPIIGETTNSIFVEGATVAKTVADAKAYIAARLSKVGLCCVVWDYPARRQGHAPRKC